MPPTLPLPNPHERFNQRYEGYPSAHFASAVEFNNFTTALRATHTSFRTKIRKAKVRMGYGTIAKREFIVMLVPPTPPSAAHRRTP